MTPLPAPPAEALHILPPASSMALLAGAAAILLLLAFLVLRRLFPKRQPSVVQPPSPVTPVPTPQPATDIASRIRSLEEKILRSKAFRDGCHRLAMLIKSHLGRSTDLDAERMTSSEIDRAFEGARKDPRLGDFLTGLSWRRYGREEPRRRDFVAACKEARELFVATGGLSSGKTSR